MVEDVGDLVGREPDVDRVEDRTGLEHAVVGLEEVMGVVGDERDPVAGFDPEPGERVGQAMRPLAERPVGELLLAVDDADLVAEVRPGAITELEDRERYEHRGPPCSIAGLPAGPGTRRDTIACGGPRWDCAFLIGATLARRANSRPTGRLSPDGPTLARRADSRPQYETGPRAGFLPPGVLSFSVRPGVWAGRRC